MNITRGKLAKLTGCHLETVRYYESIGLMPEPVRAENGFRIYSDKDVRRLKFLMRARELGFAMAEVQGLLSMVDNNSYSCGQVHDMTLSHLESVRTKIADLNRLEGVLSDMAAQCGGGVVPNCPVIDALDGVMPEGKKA
ncbi:helix-turn-helix domain-containing protein [uncultured Maricaulis sp.]|uniref:MerR family transcriptional regulator n=1 Tax=uncultured Maricaulis sp. TaxID=174710 RepID=UPI0030D8DEE8|tara:strand:+ start:48012 stop:48428 length:417 start_codon:yes stop_codon:yes gene_type:complete